MPTVLRLDGVRVVIYSNDHRPAHVHVVGAGGEAVFVLHCPEGPPTLRDSYGFNRLDIGRLKSSIAEHLAHLCREWSAIHDHA